MREATADNMSPAAGCFLWSEKLDGVFARWNGRELVSRNGRVFPAPAFFIKRMRAEAGFPAWGSFARRLLRRVPLEGELWLGRGRFQDVLRVVNNPDHPGWRELRFVAFDVPGAGLLSVLVLPLLALLSGVEAVRFRLALNPAARLAKVIAAGGEGIVLRGFGGRVCKLKGRSDAEAVVTGHNARRSVKARCMATGAEFSLAVPEDRPGVGSVVTFGFVGRYESGKPREPVFKSVRDYE